MSTQPTTAPATEQPQSHTVRNILIALFLIIGAAVIINREFSESKAPNDDTRWEIRRDTIVQADHDFTRARNIGDQTGAVKARGVLYDTCPTLRNLATPVSRDAKVAQVLAGGVCVLYGYNMDDLNYPASVE